MRKYASDMGRTGENHTFYQLFEKSFHVFAGDITDATCSTGKV